jgi:hypothetical protein
MKSFLFIKLVLQRRPHGRFVCRWQRNEGNITPRNSASQHNSTAPRHAVNFLPSSFCLLLASFSNEISRSFLFVSQQRNEGRIILYSASQHKTIMKKKREEDKRRKRDGRN